MTTIERRPPRSTRGYPRRTSRRIPLERPEASSPRGVRLAGPYHQAIPGRPPGGQGNRLPPRPTRPDRRYPTPWSCCRRPGRLLQPCLCCRTVSAPSVSASTGRGAQSPHPPFRARIPNVCAIGPYPATACQSVELLPFRCAPCVRLTPPVHCGGDPHTPCQPSCPSAALRHTTRAHVVHQQWPRRWALL